MLERVRKEVLEKKETGLYNCIYGIQYFASKKLVIKMMYPNNHFQSICETPSDFRTVSGFPHTRVRKMFLNHDIKEDKTPYWMEVVHGHNVNNSFRIDVRLKNILPFKKLNLNEFGSDITLSSARNTMNSLFRVPLMFARTACRGIWRHFLKGIGKYKYTPREFKFPDAD